MDDYMDDDDDNGGNGDAGVSVSSALISLQTMLDIMAADAKKAADRAALMGGSAGHVDSASTKSAKARGWKAEAAAAAAAAAAANGSSGQVESASKKAANARAAAAQAREQRATRRSVNNAQDHLHDAELELEAAKQRLTEAEKADVAANENSSLDNWSASKIRVLDAKEAGTPIDHFDAKANGSHDIFKVIHPLLASNPNATAIGIEILTRSSRERKDEAEKEGRNKKTHIKANFSRRYRKHSYWGIVPTTKIWERSGIKTGVLYGTNGSRSRYILDESNELWHSNNPLATKVMDTITNLTLSDTDIDVKIRFTVMPRAAKPPYNRGKVPAKAGGVAYATQYTPQLLDSLNFDDCCTHEDEEGEQSLARQVPPVECLEELDPPLLRLLESVGEAEAAAVSKYEATEAFATSGAAFIRAKAARRVVDSILDELANADYADEEEAEAVAEAASAKCFEDAWNPYNPTGKSDNNNSSDNSTVESEDEMDEDAPPPRQGAKCIPRIVFGTYGHDWHQYKYGFAMKGGKVRYDFGDFSSVAAVEAAIQLLRFEAEHGRVTEGRSASAVAAGLKMTPFADLRALLKYEGMNGYIVEGATADGVVYTCQKYDESADFGVTPEECRALFASRRLRLYAVDRRGNTYTDANGFDLGNHDNIDARYGATYIVYTDGHGDACTSDSGKHSIVQRHKAEMERAEKLAAKQAKRAEKLAAKQPTPEQAAAAAAAAERSWFGKEDAKLLFEPMPVLSPMPTPVLRVSHAYYIGPLQGAIYIDNVGVIKSSQFPWGPGGARYNVVQTTGHIDLHAVYASLVAAGARVFKEYDSGKLVRLRVYTRLSPQQHLAATELHCNERKLARQLEKEVRGLKSEAGCTESAEILEVGIVIHESLRRERMAQAAEAAAELAHNAAAAADSADAEEAARDAALLATAKQYVEEATSLPALHKAAMARVRKAAAASAVKPKNKRSRRKAYAAPDEDEEMPARRSDNNSAALDRVLVISALPVPPHELEPDIRSAEEWGRYFPMRRLVRGTMLHPKYMSFFEGPGAGVAMDKCIPGPIACRFPQYLTPQERVEKGIVHVDPLLVQHDATQSYTGLALRLVVNGTIGVFSSFDDIRPFDASIPLEKQDPYALYGVQLKPGAKLPVTHGPDCDWSWLVVDKRSGLLTLPALMTLLKDSPAFATDWDIVGIWVPCRTEDASGMRDVILEATSNDYVAFPAGLPTEPLRSDGSKHDDATKAHMADAARSYKLMKSLINIVIGEAGKKWNTKVDVQSFPTLEAAEAARDAIEASEIAHTEELHAALGEAVHTTKIAEKAYLRALILQIWIPRRQSRRVLATSERLFAAYLDAEAACENPALFAPSDDMDELRRLEAAFHEARDALKASFALYVAFRWKYFTTVAAAAALNADEKAKLEAMRQQAIEEAETSAESVDAADAALSYATVLGEEELAQAAYDQRSKGFHHHAFIRPNEVSRGVMEYDVHATVSQLLTSGFRPFYFQILAAQRDALYARIREILAACPSAIIVAIKTDCVWVYYPDRALNTFAQTVKSEQYPADWHVVFRDESDEKLKMPTCPPAEDAKRAGHVFKVTPPVKTQDYFFDNDNDVRAILATVRPFRRLQFLADAAGAGKSFQIERIIRLECERRGLPLSAAIFTNPNNEQKQDVARHKTMLERHTNKAVGLQGALVSMTACRLLGLVPHDGYVVVHKKGGSDVDLSGVHYIVWDECYLHPPETVAHIAAFMKAHPHITFFAAGDTAQLGPVSRLRDKLQTGAPKSAYFESLWAPLFPNRVRLTQNHRMESTEDQERCIPLKALVYTDPVKVSKQTKRELTQQVPDTLMRRRVEVEEMIEMDVEVAKHTAELAQLNAGIAAFKPYGSSMPDFKSIFTLGSSGSSGSSDKGAEGVLCLTWLRATARWATDELRKLHCAWKREKGTLLMPKLHDFAPRVGETMRATMYFKHGGVAAYSNTQWRVTPTGVQPKDADAERPAKRARRTETEEAAAEPAYVFDLVSVDDPDQIMLGVTFSALRRYFMFPYAQTVDSIQGATVHEHVVMFDWQMNTNPAWYYTGMLRATAFSRLHFAAFVPPYDVVLRERQMKRWQTKISGHKNDDVKKKRKFKPCDYADAALAMDLTEKQEGLCYHCKCEVDVLAPPRAPNLATLDRFNNWMPHIRGNVCIACYRCNCAQKTTPVAAGCEDQQRSSAARFPPVVSFPAASVPASVPAAGAGAGAEEDAPMFCSGVQVAKAPTRSIDSWIMDVEDEFAVEESYSEEELAAFDEVQEQPREQEETDDYDDVWSHSIPDDEM